MKILKLCMYAIIIYYFKSVLTHNDKFSIFLFAEREFLSFYH